MPRSAPLNVFGRPYSVKHKWKNTHVCSYQCQHYRKKGYSCNIQLVIDTQNKSIMVSGKHCKTCNDNYAIQSKACGVFSEYRVTNTSEDSLPNYISPIQKNSNTNISLLSSSQKPSVLDNASITHNVSSLGTQKESSFEIAQAQTNNLNATSTSMLTAGIPALHDDFPQSLIPSTLNKQTKNNDESSAPASRSGIDFSNIDHTQFIFEYVDALAQNHESWLSPENIWKKVYGEIILHIPLYKGPIKKQIVNRVNNTRSKENGSIKSFIQKIQTEPHCFVSWEDQHHFVQCVTNVKDKESSKSYSEFLIFGHPNLIKKLKVKGAQWNVDGTFSVCTDDYYQLVVIMTHDQENKYNLPVLYILMTSKTESMYRRVFEEVRSLTDYAASPGNVLCDFEKALMNALRKVFPEAIVRGCLFHWKQAIRRHMISVLHFKEATVNKIMEVNNLDILTIIPMGEIESKGIPFVQNKMADYEDDKKWDSFWAYFKRVWMKIDEIWNINDYISKGNVDVYELLNRTNNALERYNKKLKNEIGTSPSLSHFFEGLKQQAVNHKNELKAMADGISEAPKMAEINIPDIPDEYKQRSRG